MLPMQKFPFRIQAMSALEGFISSYGKEVGLSSLALNEQGMCALGFDDKINVDIVDRSDQDQIVLLAKIGSVPADGKESLYEMLLAGNAFGSETAGAAIGVNKNDGAIVLSYILVESMLSYDLFKIILSNFVDIAETWIDKIAAFAPEVSGGTEGSFVPEFAQMRI
jgi:hypothetical protein